MQWTQAEIASGRPESDLHAWHKDSLFLVGARQAQQQFESSLMVAVEVVLSCDDDPAESFAPSAFRECARGRDEWSPELLLHSMTSCYGDTALLILIE